MNLVTRNSDTNVEKIYNGYVITLTGRDIDSNYKTEKVFVSSINDVRETLVCYFELKED